MAEGTSKETSLVPSSLPLDRIRISHWSVQAAIGVYEQELVGTQELVLDLAIWGDFRKAGASDDLADAVDYAELKGRLEDWLADRRWQLLEAFADQFCVQVLTHPLVQKVELTVGKPAALAPALVRYTCIREK